MWLTYNSPTQCVQPSGLQYVCICATIATLCFKTFSSSHRETLYVLAVTPNFPPRPGQPVIYFLSLWMDLTILGILYQLTQVLDSKICIHQTLAQESRQITNPFRNLIDCFYVTLEVHRMHTSGILHVRSTQKCKYSILGEKWRAIT